MKEQVTLTPGQVLAPTPGPNKALPVLNPVKTRSSIAAVLALITVLAPILGGGLGGVAADIVANTDAVQDGASTVVDSINILLGTGALIWFWAERRAPNFRLSFTKK